MSVAALVPTRNAGPDIERCLGPLVACERVDAVLVIDSESVDGTPDRALALGADVMGIPAAEFDHGATRELGRQRLNTDVVMMLSQDASPRSPEDVATLAAPVVSRTVAVAYGRQVPRPGAGLIERFGREFGYPPDGNVRSIDDAPRFGARLSFCSNAFAAYRNDLLDEVGGFPATPAHEDAIATARLLRAGHRVAYVADAVVEHSHRPALASEAWRYWEGGLARGLFREDLDFGSGHGRLGRSYARGLLERAWRRDRRALPAVVAQLATRWTAYRLGGALATAKRRARSGRHRHA